ncbi:hypothetical protein COLO4_30305 [Corchorus olitorius]|uniref:Uncharacterized protein n=1 Tax=Corchorus olitorius TaxID=93759 RepID=A0A1R3H940_9ROSI|nr:hypothetical protein COLO4_30305 [Corchorus olitorius]
MAKLNPDIAVVLDDSRVDKKVANKHYKYKGSEPCDVKEACSENPVLFSSDSTHQFPEAEKKTAGDQKAIENVSTKSSFATKDAHNLIKFGSIHDTSKISVASELNGHYSTQHHLINGRNSNNVEDSQSTCSNHNAASQHSLTFLQKEGDLTDLASKLNVWSLDRPYLCETGNNDQLNKSGRVCINNSKKNVYEPISGIGIRDSESSALSGTQKQLTNRSKGDDTVESHISLSVGDNCNISSTFGTIGNVESIVFSNHVKQTGVTKRDSNLSVSDIQANEGLDHHSWPESKHTSLIRFDELDICLPDEDSLITVDDYIYPQESMFVAAGNTSNDERLADCGVATSDERFNLADFGNHTSFHGTHDPVSLDSSFKSPQKPQSYTQLHHSQLKTTKARMSTSKLQDRRSSRIRPRKIKNYPYNLQSIQYYPNGYLTTPQYLQATATGVDRSVNHQCLQVLPIPGLPHQLYGVPRVAYPQYTSNEMVYYTGEQNAMLNSSPSFKQQCYSNLGNASSRYYEMGIGSRADASPKYGCSYPGSFAKTG